MTYPALDSTLVQTQPASWRRRKRRERWGERGQSALYIAGLVLAVVVFLYPEWVLELVRRWM